MTVETVLWLAVTFVAAQGGVVVYQLAIAFVARTCGVLVEAVGIGFGPAWCRFMAFGFPVQIGWIPFGGYTRMFGSDPEAKVVPDAPEDGSFHAASLGQRFGIIVSGPLSAIATGSLLLAVAILSGAPQLAGVEARASQIRPCACSGLELRAESSTMSGQSRLLDRVFFGWLKRLFFLAPADGWGAYVGAVVTIAKCGEHSVSAWLSLLAVIAFFGMALAQLLPLPGYCGGTLISFAIEAITGRRYGVRDNGFLLVLQAITMLASLGRILWMDYAWLKATFWGP